MYKMLFVYIFIGEVVWFTLLCVYIIMCYMVVFMQSVCRFKEDCRIQVQKCVCVFFKDFIMLNGFWNLKNSEVGTGANPYECQRCGNWSKSHQRFHFENNFPCWLLFCALHEWCSVHLRTILMCGIWMDTWKLWSFELRSH